MNDILLDRYAQLIVKTGANIQPGQTLVISAPTECASFARAMARIAYTVGARDVVMNWVDDTMSQLRFLHAPADLFDTVPEWVTQFYVPYARQGAAFVSIAASDPELLKDVEPDRIVRAQKARSTALKEHRERLMSNQNAWCVVSIPTGAWASKVFPGLPEEEAVDRLWEAIVKTVRVDRDDPVAAWKEHKAALSKRLGLLNGAGLRSLHLSNSLGTDLTVELPEGHLWLGGSEKTTEGVEFIANMPTEEVFTVPKRTGVNGTVVSSMPLNLNGVLVEGFSLTFVDGRIVAFSAERGSEALKGLIGTDEGSHFLGEVALVPYDSPISNLKLLFYNTLFDENASCHLAIGKAYSVCVKGTEGMGKEELEALGVNDSLVHEDFMFGTEDLEITGITATGQEIPVFRNGNFVEVS